MMTTTTMTRPGSANIGTRVLEALAALSRACLRVAECQLIDSCPYSRDVSRALFALEGWTSGFPPNTGGKRLVRLI